MADRCVHDRDALPDVLQRGLDVVFCGSAAGTRSAQARAYYAGPGNRFWPVLYACGLVPVELEAAAYGQVARYGIGLTDLAKRVSGADAALRPADYDAELLRQKMVHWAPRALAFNGRRAASLFLYRRVEWGMQPEKIAQTRIFALPSTSGAARGFWDDRPWFDLAEWVRKPAKNQES